MLAHLQLVIVQKLRHGESFLLSWRDTTVIGDGRSSAWLNPAIPLYFKFAGDHAPTINPNWVAQLSRSANSSQGLVVTAEESAAVDATHTPKIEPAIGIRAAAQTRATKASVSER
ncbi:MULTISPECIES: ATP-dependent DNA ligase [Cryobacterium]|nr:MULTISPECIES: ATP-dependent DNA ligase [Cryobacterium]